MNITTSMVDCRDPLSRNLHPTLIFDDSLPRERHSEFGQSKAARPGQWLVVNSPHHPDHKLATNIIALGETRIRIPLFSYNTNGRSFETVVGSAVHLALSVAAKFNWKDIDHVHIAVGSVFETVGSEHEGFQLWLGLAFHHTKEITQ